MKVAITIDIDWAPDIVLAHTLELFSEAGLPCTLFATHASSCLNGLDKQKFEIGIHPNFNPLLNRDTRKPEAIMEPLIKAFPEARGIRSHSSMVSNILIEQFGKMGFQYESNVCLPYSQNLEVLPLWNGMFRVPFNWEDYLHFSFGKSFASTELNFSKELNILNFHPVHIFINSDSRKRYEAARPFYQDPDHLKKFRNKGQGTATLLNSLLKSNYEFVKIDDIVNQIQP